MHPNCDIVCDERQLVDQIALEANSPFEVLEVDKQTIDKLGEEDVLGDVADLRIPYLGVLLLEIFVANLQRELAYSVSR